MFFIFKYVWYLRYVKIFFMGYLITFMNRLLSRLCPIIIGSEWLCSFYNREVLVNDIKYNILGAHTNTDDITNRFRLYCAMNDIIFIDELIQSMPESFRGCNRLRILVKSENEYRQIEIDLFNKIYMGFRPVKITQNQLVFDF